MATTDDLIISLRADVGQLRTQLNNVNQQLQQTQNAGDGAARAVKNMAVGLLSMFGAMEGLQKLIEVNRQFGILKAGLETATGSLEGANEAFGTLQQFAQQTPYDLAQAVDGFTKLVNLGLTPSERALKSYGDTSAALGKDLSQMIEAVADAATGEFERLKEFGIKSKNQGDTIAFTFKGTTQVIANNAAAIEEYLIKLGEVNFDGAMKKRMESLDGAIANFGDAWDNLFFQIGEAGATDVLQDAFVGASAALAELNAMLASGELQGYIEAVGIAFDGWTTDVRNAIDEIQLIISEWGNENESEITEIVEFIKYAFSELPQNIRAFVKIAAVELADLVTEAEIYGRKIASVLNPLAPSYNLKQNLDATKQAYQETIAEILAERDKLVNESQARKEKAQNDRVLNDLLDKFLAETNTGGLAKHGVKREADAPKVDTKKADQEAKKLEQLKQDALKELDVISEKNMTEQQLQEKQYNEQIGRLGFYLKSKLITTQQYFDAVQALNQANAKAQMDDELKLFEDQQALAEKQAALDLEVESARLERLNDISKSIIQGGMTELEILDANHAAKLEKLNQLALENIEFQDLVHQLEEEAERQHQSKKLDMILGTGNKIQEMTKAFQKGQLQGALSFFAADFGGMSQHSRKMFELTKAARLADAAILLPSTVMEAARQGTKIGGWPLGAAWGAAALASQLANLRQIQAATFGGGASGGGGGGGGGGGSSFVPSANEPQQQAPITQRFVNVGIYGGEDSMYSRESVLKLMSRISEEVNDGAVIRVV